MTLSFGSYGETRLMQQSKSDLETRIHKPTSMDQCIIYWFVGRSKIRISTVITDIINILFSLFVLSVGGMLVKEALVVLDNLS